MKRLFLTSSLDETAKGVAKFVGNCKGLKLVFIKTASEVEVDDLQWLEDDRQALVDVGFEVTDYTFSNKSKKEVKKDLEKFDVICIEGGNTFYLLSKIQESGCAEIIQDFVLNKNKIYIGSSAGSIIAGPDISPTKNIDEVKKAGSLKNYKGLGLVDFVIFPHWGSVFFREMYLNNRLDIAYDSFQKFILLNDKQFVRVEGEMYRIEEV